MFRYYLTFPSVTPAQRAMNALQQVGIGTKLIRSPKFLNEKGCAYALILSPEKLKNAVNALTARGIEYAAVYKVYANGGFEVMKL